MNVHNDALQQAANAVMLEETDDVLVEQDMDESAQLLEESALTVDGYGRTVEDISLVAESLESYMSRFMGAVPEGEWNQRVARQYQLGMNALLSSQGVAMESSLFCESFEAVGSTQTGEENREKSKAKGESLAARAWETVVAALTSLYDAIVTMIASIGKNESALRKMAANLQAGVKNVAGKPTKDVFEGQPAWADYLVVGGKQVSSNDAFQVAWEKGGGQSIQWMNNYLNAFKLVRERFEKGEEVSDADFKALEANDKFIYKIQWPCSKDTEVTSEEDQFSPLTAKIITKTVDSNVKVVADVLTIEGIGKVAEGIVHLANMMKDINGKMKYVLGEANKAKAASKKEGNATAAKVLTKLLPKIPLGPRTYLPLAGATAQKAYKHAKASLALYEKK